MLFTDLVGSSDVAVELGDQRWRRLQTRHHAEIRRRLKRHGGREVDTAGDGFFATFSRPADAVRCAAEIAEAVRALGLEVRAGVHIGEAELAGEKVSGIAVTTAARVAAMAGAGQVLATDTIVHLVAGSSLEFSDAGTHELKGVPGTWRLSSLVAVDGRPLATPLDPDDARRARERSSPAEPSHRARPRALIAVAATLAVALVAVAVVFRHDRQNAPGASQSSEPQAGLVALREATGDRAFPIDVPLWRTNELAGQIAFTGRPNTPSYFGWLPHGVLQFKLRVAQVNRTSGAVVRSDISFDTDQTTCVCVAAADGYLWTPIDPGAIFSRGITLRGISLGGTARRDIVVDPDLEFGGVLALVAGAGYLWMGDSTNNRVYRIDPGNSRVKRFSVGQSVDQLTFGDGALWVLDTLQGKITRVDPATGRSPTPLIVAGDLKSVVVGGGYLWAADATGNAIQRIPEDLRSKPTAVSLSGVATRPRVVAYDDGAIVVGFEDGTVAKIGPANPTTPTVLWVRQVGNSVSSITVDRGIVWAAGSRTS
jgi:Adenylate and Guanylate cyclase catalytic domain